MKMPKLSVPVDDLIDLIDEYDAWSGSLRPEEREEYLERFAKLRARAERLKQKFEED